MLLCLLLIVIFIYLIKARPKPVEKDLILVRLTKTIWVSELIHFPKPSTC
jgi:hypothetical protein